MNDPTTSSRLTSPIFKAYKYTFKRLSAGDLLWAVPFTTVGGDVAGMWKRHFSLGLPSLSPASGHIRFVRLIELGAGFHGDLTGRENIFLTGLLVGLSRREIQAREKRIVDFAGLGDIIDSPVGVQRS